MDRWLRSLLVLALCTGFLLGHEVAADRERVQALVQGPAGHGRVPVLPDRLPDDSPRPPDVVLILTDDQRPDTVARMRTVREKLRDKGVRFARTVAPTATCCPSRASIATGLFAHDTGVWGNTPPFGGWKSFYENGNEDRTLVKALDEHGYTTGLFGKYANGYAQNPLGASAGHVPVGWDTFLTFADTTGAYYDYRLTDGTWHGRGDRQYSTDVLGARAARFVRQTPTSEPLFLTFTPFAPHKPYRPARRHRNDLAHELRSYRPPSVTERVLDKPEFLREQARVPQHSIDYIRARQQEQLMAVDEAVARILTALRDSGRLRNTLLVYMSDNGLMVGDHRTLGKDMPYRFATDVPLIVRWDGRVPQGVVDHRLAATLDVTTTIARATGVPMATSGLDLLDTVKRSDLVLEGRRWQRLDGSIPHPAYCGLRSASHLFVRWADGFEELYDYALDPFETRNRARWPAYSGIADRMRATTQAECSPVPPGFSWTGGAT
jgi:N-acetylglucosamine-6-sulfatase